MRNTIPGNKRAVIFLGKVILWLAVISLIVVAFMSGIDYAIYSYKTYNISRCLNYAICAAAQEVDTSGEDSLSGLSEENVESKGKISLKKIRLDETKAENIFWSTLKSNTGIEKSQLENNCLMIFTYDSGNAVNYYWKKGGVTATGSVASANLLESVINNAIRTCWPQGEDSHVIYIGGNPKTNDFKSRPCFMAFVKNHQINGLYSKREATFVAFKRAKLER